MLSVNRENKITVYQSETHNKMCQSVSRQWNSGCQLC